MDIFELVHETDDRSSKPFKCSICSKQFSRKSDLARHNRIHTNDRPYVCQYPGCKRAFIQRSALNVHSRIHSGERPHVCEFPDCNKAFSDSSSLARHRRVHTGVRPYRCSVPECRKSFCRRVTLQRHIRHAHGVINQSRTTYSFPDLPKAPTSPSNSVSSPAPASTNNATTIDKNSIYAKTSASSTPAASTPAETSRSRSRDYTPDINDASSIVSVSTTDNNHSNPLGITRLPSASGTTYQKLSPSPETPQVATLPSAFSPLSIHDSSNGYAYAHHYSSQHQHQHQQQQPVYSHNNTSTSHLHPTVVTQTQPQHQEQPSSASRHSLYSSPRLPPPPDYSLTSRPASNPPAYVPPSLHRRRVPSPLNSIPSYDGQYSTWPPPAPSPAVTSGSASLPVPSPHFNPQHFQHSHPHPQSHLPHPHPQSRAYSASYDVYHPSSGGSVPVTDAFTPPPSSGYVVTSPNGRELVSPRFPPHTYTSPAMSPVSPYHRQTSNPTYYHLDHQPYQQHQSSSSSAAASPSHYSYTYNNRPHSSSSSSTYSEPPPPPSHHYHHHHQYQQQSQPSYYGHHKQLSSNTKDYGMPLAPINPGNTDSHNDSPYSAPPTSTCPLPSSQPPHSHSSSNNNNSKDSTIRGRPSPTFPYAYSA